MRILVNDNRKFVCEYEPCKRILLIREGFRETEGGKLKYKFAPHYLQFPYFIVGSCFGSFCIGFSRKPIQSLNDKVYTTVLGNTSDNFTICLGNAAYKMKPNTPMVTAIYLEQIFWKTGFACGTSWYGVKLLRKTKLKNFRNWEAMTKAGKEEEIFEALTSHRFCDTFDKFAYINDKKEFLNGKLDQDILPKVQECKLAVLGRPK